MTIVAVLMSSGNTPTAEAATVQGSMGVSAMVLATCTVTARNLAAMLKTLATPGSNVCGPSMTSSITLVPPVITRERDESIGVTRITVAF